MNLKNYFKEKKGTGIIATSDTDGNINQAVYASPHILSEDKIAFIMRDRKTHSNINNNPNASYLFIENTDGYSGIRLSLTKISEEKNSDLLFSLRRKKDAEPLNEDLFLVFFKVTDKLPLINK